MNGLFHQMYELLAVEAAVDLLLDLKVLHPQNAKQTHKYFDVERLVISDDDLLLIERCSESDQSWQILRQVVLESVSGHQLLSSVRLLNLLVYFLFYMGMFRFAHGVAPHFSL